MPEPDPGASPPTSTEPARVEQWLPGYEIVGALASGGMAEIFLAWQTKSGGFRRKVVLKRIHPEGSPRNFPPIVGVSAA